MSVPQRVLAAVLAALLGAQAIGKLLDMRLYVVALDRFRALPKNATPTVAMVWVVLELLALLASRCRARLRRGQSPRRMALEGIAGGQSGAVVVVQRTSSDLKLNPDLHVVFLDGVYRAQREHVLLHELPHLRTRGRRAHARHGAHGPRTSAAATVAYERLRLGAAEGGPQAKQISGSGGPPGWTTSH